MQLSKRYIASYHVRTALFILCMAPACGTDVPKEVDKVEDERETEIDINSTTNTDNTDTQFQTDNPKKNETDAETDEETDTDIHSTTNAENTDSYSLIDTTTLASTNLDTGENNPTETKEKDRRHDTSTDVDTTGFDNREPVYPTVTLSGGSGNVTTYGNLLDPEPSAGGACNFGTTEVLSFAAINVNVSPGDGAGHWDGGRICGQCAEVTAKTPTGLITTVVRIMDKCPDDHCGIDLGGLPAQVIMGTQAGRYDGEWTFVPCEGHDNVSDGPTSIFVKEGSSEWWALIQVRNPPAKVIAILYNTSSESGSLSYATEAENFFSVPETVRTSSEDIALTIEYDFEFTHAVTVSATEITSENNLIPL